jgi:hypothetical protein
MNPKLVFMGATMLAAATCVNAQVDTSSAAINAARAASANRSEAIEANAAVTMNADQQAQYEKDMAAYRDALSAQQHAKFADERRYDRQQRAYAQAVFDWRLQVEACHRGNNRACNAPTPNPADYL